MGSGGGRDGGAGGSRLGACTASAAYCPISQISSCRRCCERAKGGKAEQDFPGRKSEKICCLGQPCRCRPLLQGKKTVFQAGFGCCVPSGCGKKPASSSARAIVWLTGSRAPP